MKSPIADGKNLAGRALSSRASRATCSGVGRGAPVKVAPYSRKLTTASSSPCARRARMARSRRATQPGQAASRAAGARSSSGSKSGRRASITTLASAYGMFSTAGSASGAAGCNARGREITKAANAQTSTILYGKDIALGIYYGRPAGATARAASFNILNTHPIIWLQSGSSYQLFVSGRRAQRLAAQGRIDSCSRRAPLPPHDRGMALACKGSFRSFAQGGRGAPRACAAQGAGPGTTLAARGTAIVVTRVARRRDVLGGERYLP